LTIRRATYNDLDEILQLFYNTVTEVCSFDYTKDQIGVWVASADKRQQWLERIARQYFLVAENDSKIVGFGSLENGDYVDLLYVHKDYQRQGVASELIKVLESESARCGSNRVSADASITARPFFERYGYKVLKEQKKSIQSVEIINYWMVKELK
jgi:putative acetyltransferase